MGRKVMSPLAAALIIGAMAVPALPKSLDVERIESVLGLKGTLQGGELKITVPQKELDVRVDGFPIVPAMGLTSWVAFTPHGRRVMAMGDLVLLEDEIGPVQRVAVEAGLAVTALHNHFLRDMPKVMFMHVGAMGEAEAVAKGVRAALDKVRELRAVKGLAPGPETATGNLDAAEIEAILGYKGQMSNGVLKFVIGRPDVKLKDMGAPVSTFMGFNTWMAFQGGRERAAVSGDFAMLEGEVDGVIRALAAHGIEVTAVHNHMVTEKPRIFFLHFWGVDTPADLARGLKAALDKTGRRGKP